MKWVWAGFCLHLFSAGLNLGGTLSTDSMILPACLGLNAVFVGLLGGRLLRHYRHYGFGFPEREGGE